MAQWWERSPPTNVARVWFPDPASYVGWACCWFSAPRGFSTSTPVFPSPQKPTFPNSNSIWNCQALYHEPLAQAIAQVLRSLCLTLNFHLHFTFLYFWPPPTSERIKISVSVYCLVGCFAIMYFLLNSRAWIHNHRSHYHSYDNPASTNTNNHTQTDYLPTEMLG